jgi:hypothetical protein
MQINRKQLRYIYNRFGFTRPSFAYYPENSATPNKRAAYGEARVGIMTNGAAGIMVEQGTENLAPSPNDLTVKAAAAPELSIYPNYFVCADIDRAYQKCAITADGGPLFCWVDAYGTAAQIRIGLYDTTAATYLVNTTFALTGASQRLEVTVPTTTAGNTIQLLFRVFPGTTYVDWIQLERRTYGTSKINGTRAHETLSMPGLPTVEGEIEVTVDVTDKCKRQVANVYPALVTITRANGDIGLSLYHSPGADAFAFYTRNDANEQTRVNFADSLIPNGTRTLKISITTSAVILYCDGAEIARIDNPKLPSGWGRIYLGSSATGTNHADAMFGGIKMIAPDSTVLSDILFNGPDFIRKARTIQL